MTSSVPKALALGLTLIGLTAAAPAPARIRATIDSVSGQTLVLTPRSGPKVTVTLAADARVVGVNKGQLTDIAPNSYVGTAAALQPDGTLRALEVHVFAPALRGSGDGHRPWGDNPNDSMTNGTVGDVIGSKGRTMTVRYSSGEKQVVVPEDVPIVIMEPIDRSQVVAGAHVIVTATKAADGSMSANSIIVGEHGTVPPM